MITTTVTGETRPIKNTHQLTHPPTHSLTRHVAEVPLENIDHVSGGAADDPCPASAGAERQLVLHPRQVLDGVGRLEEEIVGAGALSPVVGAHSVDLDRVKLRRHGWHRD